MRKGQKKKKDVMKLKDHSMVKFWDEEESPLFNGENHEFMDSIFTRDPRLKNVLVRMRSMFDPVTTDCYNSYELTIMEPEECLKVEIPSQVQPDQGPVKVFTEGQPAQDGNTIPTPRLSDA